MTRPVPDSDQTDEASSRRSRLKARRERRVRIATVAFVVVVITAGVGAALYAVDDNGAPAKAAATSTVAPSTATFGKRVLPRIAADTSPTIRTLSHDRPLRLWVGGDSLAGLLGAALGDQVSATGVVKTRVDYKVSSGLWSNDLRNWPDRAAEEMKTDNPEAVVYIIGANDTAGVNEVDADHNGVPDWEEAYRAKVDRMMNEFIGPEHRTVFWLGAPTLGNGMDAQAVEINRVIKEEALKHAPDVVYVDTYHLFSGPDGKYSREIVDEKGNTIVARIADGVHFTEDGSAYLARAVFTLIEARFHVMEHADRAHPIAWSFASGSGELVPGYNQAPRSRYGSSSDGNSSSTHTTYQTSGSYTPTTYVSDPPTTGVPSPPTTSAPPPPPPPPPPPTSVASPPTT